MPLPGSGQISVNDVATEFGGTTPHSLSEYYGADTGVPASGAISLSDFYGTSATNPPTSINIYMVGGGGGGGDRQGITSIDAAGGGGGGGQYVATLNQSISSGTYDITIGEGGGSHRDGKDSSFVRSGLVNIVAQGGSKGWSYIGGIGSFGTNGGGGEAWDCTTTGTTSPSWSSYSGGAGSADCTNDTFAGGGGMGTDGSGQNASSGATSAVGGDGGSWIHMPITGSSNRRVGAGGGGGVSLPNETSSADFLRGDGGRGNSSYGRGALVDGNTSTAALSGRDGFGEGGGGGAAVGGTSQSGGSGGDGYMVITHATGFDDLTFSPAADSVLTDGSLRYYRISTSCTMTVS